MGKDVEWKAFLEDNHRYADIINGIGCGGLQLVKDTDIQEADVTSRKKYRDLLRRVAVGINFLIVGIENQEEVDYELPLRIMNYDVSKYQKEASGIRKKVQANARGLNPGEYLYGFMKDSKLSPLVTFVLYAGKEAWDGPSCLHDILDFTDVPDRLKNMISNYKINVVDIRRFTNTDVFTTDVKHVFDFIRCSDDKKKLLDLVEKDIYYKQMDIDAFDVVTKYTNSEELVKVREFQTEGGTRDVCKAIRDLMDDSREEGREEGIVLTKLENAKNLLDVLNDEVIAEKIGLPLEQIRALREQKIS